jgi:hypothetical protein
VQKLHTILGSLVRISEDGSEVSAVRVALFTSNIVCDISEIKRSRSLFPLHISVLNKSFRIDIKHQQLNNSHIGRYRCRNIFSCNVCDVLISSTSCIGIICLLKSDLSLLTDILHTMKFDIYYCVTLIVFMTNKIYNFVNISCMISGLFLRSLLAQ